MQTALKQILSLTMVILAAANAAASKGYLFIESQPPGAIVTFDGAKAPIYTAPVLCTLSVGEHSVSITRPYYKKKIIKVVIEPEKVTRRRVRFFEGKEYRAEPIADVGVYGKHGQLSIITYPPGATVHADGLKLDIATPLTLSSVPAGTRSFSIQYGNIRVDTLLLISGDKPQTLQLDLTSLSEGPSVAFTRSVMKVVMELPGCRYQYPDSISQDSETFLFRGVDPVLRIWTGDTGVALTHLELAEEIYSTDQSGRTTAKSMPPLELTYIFRPMVDSSVTFDLWTFASTGEDFVSTDDVQPNRTSKIIPASFNSGEEINVNIRIDPDGVIHFRYW
jgi:hypothetical protein